MRSTAMSSSRGGRDSQDGRPSDVKLGKRHSAIAQRTDASEKAEKTRGLDTRRGDNLASAWTHRYFLGSIGKVSRSRKEKLECRSKSGWRCTAQATTIHGPGAFWAAV